MIVVWIALEVRSDNPLVDMSMMRIRGVWTTNLAAFLIGAGMYSSFVVFPQFAQLPTSTGFGFGASVVVSSLYLLPSALGMVALGSVAGKVARRFGSRFALIVGTAVSAVAFFWSAIQHGHPYDILISTTLLGVGIGLAFSALGNLIVGAVEPHQTGVASGMNTVMRTLGGALGGQISATLIAAHVRHGLPDGHGVHTVATGWPRGSWSSPRSLVSWSPSDVRRSRHESQRPRPSSPRAQRHKRRRHR